MDRWWLLTWTTYGTWLPGDERGFVSNVDRGDGKGERRNIPETPFAMKQRGLQNMAGDKLRGEPVFLSQEMAVELRSQFEETAKARGWEIAAGAIMRNHVHLVVGVPGDPDPEKLLRDFKCYGSRRLKVRHPQPQSTTWWTASGSRRKLDGEESLMAAMRYVRDQEFPLEVWLNANILGERRV